MMRVFSSVVFFTATGTMLFLSGCVGVPVHGEAEAQRQTEEVGNALAQTPSLPGLAEVEFPGAYIRYALWNHPRVEAAYARWRASVAEVAVARSLPDPRLTLQFDYASDLMNLMPGLLTAYTTRGKRTAQGEAALAASEVAYRDYVATLFDVASTLRNAWLDLAYVDEMLRLKQKEVEAYDNASRAARNDYVTAGNGDLSRITKLERDAARQRSGLDILQERQKSARTAFKAAIGLGRVDPDPAWPTSKLSESSLPDEATLWTNIVAANPELEKLRAIVNEAVARTALAETAQTPDFSVGLMADVKADPLMFRPQAGVSLPIWKDKIQAGIDAANARLDAAKAGAQAWEIALAARFADALYRVGAADRMIAYIDKVALPSLHTSENIAGANFQSGLGSATEPLMAQIAIIDAEIERIGQLKDREKAVTGLLQLSAGIAPESGPLRPESSKKLQ